MGGVAPVCGSGLAVLPMQAKLQESGFRQIEARITVLPQRISSVPPGVCQGCSPWPIFR